MTALRRVSVVALLTTSLSGLIAAPPASAEPTDPAPDPAATAVPGAPAGPAPGPAQGPAPGPVAPPPDSDNPVSTACRQFSAAINLAAANYEDFAYATAGNGNVVNYDDPTVERANLIGRTALREAAALALDAANTPGVPPEVSGPMQSWSLHATKLVLIMGLRGGGDSLNNAANQLNTDSNTANLACATSGRM